jgi:hypothetical protein
VDLDLVRIQGHLLINKKFFIFSFPDSKFLGLPDPDPLVRGTDPDPNPSNSKTKIVRLVRFTMFCDFLMSLSLKTYVRKCKCSSWGRFVSCGFRCKNTY